MPTSDPLMADTAQLPLDCLASTKVTMKDRAERNFSTGILPSQTILELIATGEIVAEHPHFEPANSTCQLGSPARQSSLPGAG